MFISLLRNTLREMWNHPHARIARAMALVELIMLCGVQYYFNIL